MQNEQTLWSGSPSQCTNAGKFFLIFLFSLMFWALPGTLAFLMPVVFFSVAGWFYLVTRLTDYELTNHRLKIRRGVLSKTEEEIELYRMKDTRLVQSLYERLFSVGTIEIIASDASLRGFKIHSIPDAASVREKLRENMEARRDIKRVREIDSN